MTMFLTKVWGFHVPSGPLQFGNRGWRDRARAMLQGGPHRVVLVGTLGEETPEPQRGCILGLMEPTTEPVNSLDFDIPTRPLNFVDGRYLWPYALHNRKAWRFLEPLTKIKELSQQRFRMDSASGIVAIDDELARRIEALPHEEIELLPRSIVSQRRFEGPEIARRRNSPPPTTQRAGIMHLRREPAYTYAFRIEGASSTHFKIGWAFDHAVRNRQFNRVALPEIGGLRYSFARHQLWATARQAYSMEQAVLRPLHARRHAGNHEVIEVKEEELQYVWTDALLLVRRQTSLAPMRTRVPA
jgi:hypothetical protein